MNLPRNVRLACGANILSALYLLQGEPELSELHVDLAQDLLTDGEDMPREIMDAFAETIGEGLRDFAPNLIKLGLWAHGQPKREITLPGAPAAPGVVVTPAPAPVRQLPQDTEFDRLLSMINMPTPRGVN